MSRNGDQTEYKSPFFDYHLHYLKAGHTPHIQHLFAQQTIFFTDTKLCNKMPQKTSTTVQTLCNQIIRSSFVTNKNQKFNFYKLHTFKLVSNFPNEYDLVTTGTANKFKTISFLNNSNEMQQNIDNCNFRPMS